MNGKELHDFVAAHPYGPYIDSAKAALISDGTYGIYALRQAEHSDRGDGASIVIDDVGRYTREAAEITFTPNGTRGAYKGVVSDSGLTIQGKFACCTFTLFFVRIE